MMFLFLLPAILISLAFFYAPMFGIAMAFQDFSIVNGFFHSAFVGLENFTAFLSDPKFYIALKNTLGINFLMLVVGFPMPILFALLVNEMQPGRFKRISQTITYLPYFISWIIIAGLAYRLLEQNYGNINLLINFLGGEKIAFFRESQHFWWIVVILSIWKGLGWNSIIYLAALSGIDSELYEAATIDGAGRLQKIIYISLPGIAPTILVLFILAIGSMVTSVGGAGFDAIFNLKNAMVAKTSTTLDVYIYQQGLQMSRPSFAAAVGLMQSFIGLGLVVMANTITRKIKGYGLF